MKNITKFILENSFNETDFTVILRGGDMESKSDYISKLYNRTGVNQVELNGYITEAAFNDPYVSIVSSIIDEEVDSIIISEGFFGGLVGGLVGGSDIAKDIVTKIALGLGVSPSSPLGNLLTSRVVLGIVGSVIGMYATKK